MKKTKYCNICFKRCKIRNLSYNNVCINCKESKDLDLCPECRVRVFDSNNLIDNECTMCNKIVCTKCLHILNKYLYCTSCYYSVKDM